jgi:hypothetical protein
MLFSEKGAQTSALSWWPPSHHFDKAGLNVNFWSRRCEAWYQTRLANIHGNDPKKLMTAAEWKAWITARDRWVHQGLKNLDIKVGQLFDLYFYHT